MILVIFGFLWEEVEEDVDSGERGVRGTGNGVWSGGGRVEKDKAVLDAESGRERKRVGIRLEI